MTVLTCQIFQLVYITLIAVIIAGIVSWMITASATVDVMGTVTIVSSQSVENYRKEEDGVKPSFSFPIFSTYVDITKCHGS